MNKVIDMAWEYAEDKERKNDEKAEQYQFEVSESVEFVINQIGEGQYGKWYLVEDGDNVEWFLPGHYDLKQKLKRLKVEEDDLILVKYLGEEDIGKENPLKKYQVAVDR